MDMYVKKGYLVIKAGEEVDHHYSDSIREQIDRIIEMQGIKNIVFDFGRTRFMDSSGIGLVMGRYKKARRICGNVSLVNMTPNIERIFRMSKIERIAGIYSSLEEVMSEGLGE